MLWAQVSTAGGRRGPCPPWNFKYVNINALFNKYSLCENIPSLTDILVLSVLLTLSSRGD